MVTMTRYLERRLSRERARGRRWLVDHDAGSPEIAEARARLAAHLRAKVPAMRVLRRTRRNGGPIRLDVGGAR